MTPTDPELVTRLRADRYDSIEELFALKCEAADALEAAEARVQQLEAALTTLRDQWAQSLLTMRGEFVATQMAAVEDCIDGLAQILGRADTPEPPHED